MSDWGWCLGGAYFLAKFQAGGAYSGGAYKKSVLKVEGIRYPEKKSRVLNVPKS